MISGRISMIAHQLSLRDTTNHGGGNPGLKMPGYHQVPLRGKSQWPLPRNLLCDHLNDLRNRQVRGINHESILGGFHRSVSALLVTFVSLAKLIHHGCNRLVHSLVRQLTLPSSGASFQVCGNEELVLCVREYHRSLIPTFRHHASAPTNRTLQFDQPIANAGVRGNDRRDRRHFR